MSLWLLPSYSTTAAMSDVAPNSGVLKIRRKRRNLLAFVFWSLALFAIGYLHIRLASPLITNLRSSSIAAAVSGDDSAVSGLRRPQLADHDPFNRAIIEPESNRIRHVSSIVMRPVELETVIDQSPSVAASDRLNRTGHGLGAIVDWATSVLLPGWEVLVAVNHESRRTLDPTLTDVFYCLFQNYATSPARFAGVLPSPNRLTFLCEFPPSLRRQRPYHQPVLTRSPSDSGILRPTSELLLWKFMTYESLSTGDDVVVFAKGLNNRQGINQYPKSFNCVFFVGDDPAVRAVRTGVTHSFQEVFRCPHPILAPSLATSTNVRVSIEVAREKRVMPTTAYYKPRRLTLSEDSTTTKALTCATSMVYNVAKVLKEWVVYHSKIGIQQFVLYDNGSEDNLNSIVENLNDEGYDVRTVYWPWAKTQEAGFSHAAVSSSQSCTWMLFLDVDEFLYAPPWLNRPSPSDQMIQSDLLPSISSPSSRIGQVSISCYEFGPSGRSTHPTEGVVHGYTCRRRIEQRHKSMVLLEAIDESLLNVIHHFTLKTGFKTLHWGLENGVINHYKYQAWPEFKTKFRRRVSAYVVDWTQTVNPTSKDRTPGLGFQAVEPEDWSEKFCEVTDDRLKMLTLRWFGVESNTTEGGRVAWKRQPLHDVSYAARE